MITKSWFATLAKRDFETEEYSEGIRLYIEGIYTIICGISFCENGILTVKNSNNEYIKLTEEPDNIIFSNTLQSDWNMWNDMYGKHEPNSQEYKPFAYNSKESLAVEFGLIDYNNIKMYYNDESDDDRDGDNDSDYE
jgi:hypothetical protein